MKSIRKSTYHGFIRRDYILNGNRVFIVSPQRAAAGKPWIWRAEFFDHRPETDLALLAKGFHLVFFEITNNFGCPDAMAQWDILYQELIRKRGFAKKAALEGLSRGGLYVYNWAARNPSRVACIYADAPVCDFKSWPGGRGRSKGSPADWARLIELYHFKSEREALAYDKNPVDNLAPLAAAKVPLLHVYGDADESVPYMENTAVVTRRYRRLGGLIELIRKRGVGHHPHGLDDPAPIVDFICKHACKAL
ncbi:MAG: alpha/beta hydrolase [Kiritimatiellia bacterium]